MIVTQLTHHDLDGYGASAIVAAFLDVERIVHIPRYADVGPVVDAELKRLGRAREPECLIITDLGLEAVAVTFIIRFVSLNLRRDEGARHRLIVLDHHASSLDQLRDQGLVLTSVPETPGLHRVELLDPNVVVLIDEGRCATRLAYDYRALFATREVDDGTARDLQALVEAVDAVDLWKKERSVFRSGLALDEIFWDNIATLVPEGHPWHDRFVSALLCAAAALLRDGATPAQLESAVGGIRLRLVNDFLADEPQDDRSLTTRMRMAHALARSDALFQRLSDGTLLSFGLDSGTFQRVSDLIMETGKASRVVNVKRTGSLSFRSNDETALEGARRFRGGGHKDAAGGKLSAGSAFSRADAVAQVEPVLNPPQPDPGASPFAALRNLKI